LTLKLKQVLNNLHDTASGKVLGWSDGRGLANGHVMASASFFGKVIPTGCFGDLEASAFWQSPWPFKGKLFDSRRIGSK